MIKKVLQHIERNNIFQNGDSVILGVSGGADSICMLYVLQEISALLNLKLIAVHVNHHIRGQEADDDMLYVENLCRENSIRCEVYHIDAKKEAAERGMSEEEAGRACRYECFAKAFEKYNADKIAVAHNLNDNSETILFNLFRGTGIKGMTGIPVKRNHIVRPLLCCTRKEIEGYLAQNHITFRNDRTNFETEYSRNRLRLDVIPYIKENINRKAEYNIVNVGEMLGEVEDYLKCQTDIAFEKNVIESDNELLLKQSAYEIHPAILKRVIRKAILKEAGKLKDVTSTHIEKVVELGNFQVSKSVNLPYNLVAVKQYDGVAIRKKKEKECQQFCDIKIVENHEIVQDEKCESNIAIQIETQKFSKEDIQELVYTKWLDYDKIGTLVLRKRREGDYLIVDDKGSRKKLKEYFINEKIPKEKRDEILLLADGQHVVWIIGYRISSYYKVTNNTRKIVRIDYKV